MSGRHEKLTRGLELVRLLAGSLGGLTMQELQAEMRCSRRTVERMLAAVDQACGGLDSSVGDGGQKRWRVRPNLLSRSASLTAAEVAEMDMGARRLEAEGLAERAALMRSAAGKLRALTERAALRRAEPDVEALLAAEGLAMRPGPRILVPDRMIAALRQAIIGCRRIRLSYANAAGETREHLLEPCGLLYGARPYLLAAAPAKADAAVWRLDRIRNIQETPEPFEPRFALASLTAGSFGIWREAPMRVALRFTSAAATEAANWCFHPSQTATPQPDGSLLLHFQAGGLDEMAYHFASWGEAVEVLEPPVLRERLAALGAALSRRHGSGMSASDVAPGKVASDD